MTETMVIHIDQAPKHWKDMPDYVYIGRAGNGFDGYFGNPIKLKKGQKRGSTLEEYRHYLDTRCRTDEEFYERVIGLRGKVLVCFCKPKPCHGDILSEYIEWLWSNYGS